MEIIQKLTLQYMKLNKKRTLVTILGIIISVAMFTAVSIIIYSFQDLLVRYSYASSGKYHAFFDNVEAENLDYITEDSEVDFYMQVKEIGIAKLNDGNDTYTPYSYISAYDKNALENLPVNLIEGRLPNNSSEILISEYFMSISGGTYNIGDIIDFPMGERTLSYTTADPSGNEVTETITLDQDDYIYYDSATEKEVFVSNGTILQYTIVGVVDHYIPGPSYPFITLLEENSIGSHDVVTTYVFLKDLNNSSTEHLRNMGGQAGIDPYDDVTLNTNVFVLSGNTYDSGFNAMLFTLAGILFAIIMVGSVSLIYNAFSISLSERSKQLGMLASVGATKNQNKSSVFFEGLLIGILSIPLGILAGFGGMWITFMVLNPIITNLFEISESLRVVFSPAILIITIILSMITIFISAYIPARRAAKITPMDAIRQSTDIKLNRRQVKTSKIVTLLFGFEGEIALKNLKRYKKRYRTIVFSLAISIILFLTASSYTFYLKNAVNMTMTDADYDMSIYLNEQIPLEYILSHLEDVKSLTDYAVVSYAPIETTIMKSDGTTPLSQEYTKHIKSYYEGEDEESLAQILTSYENPYTTLIALDDESFTAFALEQGLDADEIMSADALSCILVNKAILKSGFASTELVPLDIVSHENLAITFNEYDYTNEKEEIYTDHAGNMHTYKSPTVTEYPLTEITVAGIADAPPPYLPYMSYMGDSIQMIVTESTLNRILDMVEETAPDPNGEGFSYYSELLLTSAEPASLRTELDTILGEDITNKLNINDVHEDSAKNDQMILIISIFAYGFIGLITAICIANIFNNVSTSISLRRREFAILKSVGMTPQAFNKMIYFESIFYGLKAILIALPVSLLIMYWIYRNLYAYFSTSFILPWGSLCIAAFSVFIIVLAAMLYSSSKVKKENIIDGLKIDNI